jgi:hypothetical protein
MPQAQSAPPELRSGPPIGAAAFGAPSAPRVAAPAAPRVETGPRVHRAAIGCERVAARADGAQVEAKRVRRRAARERGRRGLGAAHSAFEEKDYGGGGAYEPWRHRRRRARAWS